MIYFQNHNLTDELGYLAKTAELGYLANNSFETFIMQLSTLGMFLDPERRSGISTSLFLELHILLDMEFSKFLYFLHFMRGRIRVAWFL